MNSWNPYTPLALNEAEPNPSIRVSPYQNAVNRFMEQAGQPVRETPGIPSSEIMRGREMMLDEELCEYYDARQAVIEIRAEMDRGREIDIERYEGALAELADAQTDIIYVLLGEYSEFGFDFARCMATVIESNQSKLPGDGSAPERTDYGKVIKPDTYQPAEFRRALFGDEINMKESRE